MMKNEKVFIGYEYSERVIDKKLATLYIDGYQNFGWEIEQISGEQALINQLILKMKRNRKIKNKNELTKLQHKFEAYLKEIEQLEKSKTNRAATIAYTIGLIGTICMGGATFAYLSGFIMLCIILAIPGFIGWIMPYFCYNATYSKRSRNVASIIENGYDKVYETCESANNLLNKSEVVSV